MSVILIIVAAVLWQKRLLTPAHVHLTAVKDPKPSTVLASAKTFFASKNESWPKIPYQGLSDPRWPEMNRREKADPTWQWKMPIIFYGRVEDENSLPIFAANILLQWSDLSEKGASELLTKSDGNGLFQLTGVQGKGLTVRVSKEGYYQTKAARVSSFEYAVFAARDYIEPDPMNPIVFHLKKIGVGELLTTDRISRRAPPDGTPVRLNLLNRGLVSGDGQLIISAVTNTEKYPPRYFDWSATIAISDGGLSRTMTICRLRRRKRVTLRKLNLRSRPATP
jgi:hypothetical protein